MALLPPVREKNSTKKGRKRKRKLNDRTRERNDYIHLQYYYFCLVFMFTNNIQSYETNK